MRKILFSTLAVAALATAAQAADLPSTKSAPVFMSPAPAFTWTGFYVGANLGYGFSAANDQFRTNGVNIPTFGGISPKGVFGGGQIGYNWQFNSPLVLGLEGDFQGSGIRASSFFGGKYTAKSELDWFGTVRGRAGYAIDRALLYVTGGYAVGSIKNSVSFPGWFEGNSRTASGYAIGGGVEYALTGAWSVKAEYQYLNFGNRNLTGTQGAYTGVGGTVRDDAFHTVRLGLNYRFGEPAAPVVAKY
jgi:outer membrane immunogenic protein